MGMRITRNGNGEYLMNWKNLSVLISIFIILSSSVTYVVATRGDTNQNTKDITAIKEDIKDLDNTLPNDYVPRKEIDSRLKNIENSLDRIEKKIDKAGGA